MISATVQQCLDAHVALGNINTQTKLGAKAAWRVARLINKVKNVVRSFEEAQLKLYTDAGGIPAGNSVSIFEPKRAEQSDEEWATIMDEHKAKIGALQEQLVQLAKQPAEVDYEKIPLDLFGDAQISANDLAALESFIQE